MHALFELLKKSKEFKWDKDCDKAFIKVKK
jgi:hypothetical protein